MSLPRLSIEKPVFAWMVTLAIFLFGGISFYNLGISLLPDVDYPYVSVSVDYPGASPELVESDITEILEAALTSVEGVRSMNSSSRYGSARVSLEFDIGKNIDFALQEVQSAAQIAFRQLPNGVEAPTVRKTNPEDQPILWITLSGSVPKRELMEFARNTVKDRFTSIEGVSDVQLGGFIEPAIRVWVDPKKLSAFELTHDDIISTLEAEHIEIPAGRLQTKTNEISLRFQGEAIDLDTLRNFSITRRSGQPLYKRIQLKDVARIEAGLEDIRRFARTNGQESIGLGIIKQRGVNSVAVADRVLELVNTLDLPETYALGVNFDTTEPIRKSIHELILTLGLSIVLTSIVCWLFLGSVVSTFNILVAIPTSLFGTFIAFQGLGYTLNNFTMLALILGVGIIVDDAIMVLENIFRWRRKEKNPTQAALKGTEQVQSAAIATSLAIIAIFIPVLYVSGIIGAYLAQFAIALSIGVAFSTFEALTFTPMRLASYSSKYEFKGIPKVFDQWVEQTSVKYSNVVSKLTKTPYILYLSLLIIFVCSLLLIPLIPKELTPEDDQGILRASVELPLGTSLEETDRRLRPIEEEIIKQEGVKRVYTVIGGFGSSSVNSANLFISLQDKSDRSLTHTEIQSSLRKKLNQTKDLRVRIFSGGRQILGRGRSGSALNLTLKGDDWHTLITSSKKIEQLMSDDKHFVDVKSDLEDNSPEYRIIPNRAKALERGVSLSSIAQTIAFYHQGLKPVKYNDQGRRVHVIIQADESIRPKNPEEFQKLFIRNNRSQLVPLSDIVSIQVGSAPQSIYRENRERTIEVSANLADKVSLDVAMERAEALFNQNKFKDVRLDQSGTRGDFNRTFRDLILALALGVLVAYMVLASQYNSYVDPLLILLALPFSLSGAFIALKLSGYSLNLYSMIGLLLLMGIVKKNSIMLVEFANHIYKETKTDSRFDAMIEACRTRFRPILMTAFTTVAAAIPPAFKIGVDSSATASMSMGIIGGLILSTFLTLFLVPVAYIQLKSYIDLIRKK